LTWWAGISPLTDPSTIGGCQGVLSEPSLDQIELRPSQFNSQLQVSMISIWYMQGRMIRS
jgi:hypothetical protein